MMVTDGVRLALCLGLKETEEGFITTYTHVPHLPVQAMLESGGGGQK